MLQVETGESRVAFQDRQRALRGLPVPEPAAGLAAYEHERELALSRSPECRANYERYLASRRRGAVVDYYPIKLDIENVSRCNFRCTMCAVSDWPQRPPPFGLERNGAEAAPSHFTSKAPLSGTSSLKRLIILASFRQNSLMPLKVVSISSCNQTERRRVSSKARMANLRRDSARRSYRSKATNRFVSSEIIVASLAGPSGVLFRHFSMETGTGISASLRVPSCLMTLNFSSVSARDS
jgi:hypothetical protein